MSTLIVEELYPGVTIEQKFKVQRNANLVHYRPRIMKHGTLADGTLTCEIYKGAILLGTSTIDYTDINTIGGPYAHGHIRFDFTTLPLKVSEGEAETEFTVKLYMAGHTKDVNNFIATVKEYESYRYIRYGDIDGNGDPLNDFIQPIGYEIYVNEAI